VKQEGRMRLERPPLLTLYLIELEKITGLSALLLESPDNLCPEFLQETLESLTVAQTQLRELLAFVEDMSPAGTD
jgi:hypothetical protein